MSPVRPDVSPITDAVAGQIPGVYHAADALAPGDGWPLLRWLSAATELLARDDTLADRFAYVPEDLGPGRRTADLIDPLTCDIAWLPYVAMFAGVRDRGDQPEAERRAAIDDPSNRRAGTADAIAAAARPALTGDRHVVVVDQFGGDEWTIGLQTLVTETPDDQAVIDAVIAAGAKPVGYDLVVDHYQSSWDQQETSYPTWTGREAAGSWDTVESVQP